MAKILSIIPYEFYPPKYGGALRCFHILREMAKEHEVTLLTVQSLQDFNRKTEPSFPDNIKVVSTSDEPGYRSVFNIFPERIANAINSRLLKRSLFVLGNLYLLRTYPVLKQLLRENEFHLVNYESMDSFALLQKHVRRLSPKTLQLYDAHNVDSTLWNQFRRFDRNAALKKYANDALSMEKRFHSTLDLCFTCSEADKKKLDDLNKGRLFVKVIPNGVDCAARPFVENVDKAGIRNLLFCGTLDYAPNTEGILWFYKTVFPVLKQRFPELTLTIIGKMNQPGPYQDLVNDSSVHFVGPVDDVRPYYVASSVFIVPLFSGSGTRLKILEAASMGNPVVSTTIGAEGLVLENGRHIRIADEPQEFAVCVSELLLNKEIFNEQRHCAHTLVRQKYDWSVIGQAINREINNLLYLNSKKIAVL
ncbi:glycosyltransferase family 4 protein [Flavisolibacter nicotianae]|uniref:glycosyltransferase family 4 protein n=1 Tax=Flavisolibacter nicotianae TaxID=2364882 RepID=UPI000EB423DC|nr:glycosyltransferase family 4 protein [Flavisolibacter nicotianae]